MRSRHVPLLLVVFVATATTFAASSVTPDKDKPAATPPELSGQLIANGVKAPLAYVRAVAGADSTGKPAYWIVLTEKDATKSEEPDRDARFGTLGDALVIGVTPAGEEFSVILVLKALPPPPTAISGGVGIEGFRIESGRLSGRFYTQGERDVFGDKISFDVKVRAPLSRKK